MPSNATRFTTRPRSHQRCVLFVVAVALIMSACSDGVTAVPFAPPDAVVQNLPELRELASDVQDRIVPQLPANSARVELSKTLAALSLALAQGTAMPIKIALTSAQAALERYASTVEVDEGVNAELDVVRLQFDAIDAQVQSASGVGK